MALLITGGAGFIGAAFTKFIIKQEPTLKVVVLDKLTYAGRQENLGGYMEEITFYHGSITDEALVERIYHDHRIDGVINFAAETHVDRSIESSKLFFETNVMGLETLLRTAMAYWSSRKMEGVFMQISTDEVYGALGEEGYFTEESPFQPRSPYAASKASAELLIQSYQVTHDFLSIVLRLSNGYGPGQYPEKLIPLMINKALSGQKLPLYGDGQQVRDWLYIEDKCQGIYQGLLYGQPGAAYNLGGQQEKTNLSLVKLLLHHLQEMGYGVSEDQIVFVKDRPGHDYRYGMSHDKAKEVLKWQPTTCLEEGLKKTLLWHVKKESEAYDSIS